jgi:very-short-patch-repair endonuclease
MNGHPALKTFAKEMRRNATDAERRVWSVLRRKQVDSLKFRRQVVIGPFIVDFACLSRRLVIEVDGGQHADSDYDPRRDAWLERSGFRVLRIWNSDALERGGSDGLYRLIADALSQPVLARAVDAPSPPSAS